jgi:hypothetical protein
VLRDSLSADDWKSGWLVVGIKLQTHQLSAPLARLSHHTGRNVCVAMVRIVYKQRAARDDALGGVGSLPTKKKLRLCSFESLFETVADELRKLLQSET